MIANIGNHVKEALVYHSSLEAKVRHPLQLQFTTKGAKKEKNWGEKDILVFIDGLQSIPRDSNNKDVVAMLPLTILYHPQSSLLIII